MNESKKGNYKLRNWSFELKFKQIKTKKNVSNLSFSDYILLIYNFQERKKKRKKEKKEEEEPRIMTTTHTHILVTITRRITLCNNCYD